MEIIAIRRKTIKPEQEGQQNHSFSRNAPARMAGGHGWQSRARPTTAGSTMEHPTPHTPSYSALVNFAPQYLIKQF